MLLASMLLQVFRLLSALLLLVSILLSLLMLLLAPMHLLVFLLVLALLLLALLHYECCSMISLLLLFFLRPCRKSLLDPRRRLLHFPMPENSGPWSQVRPPSRGLHVFYCMEECKMSHSRDRKTFPTCGNAKGLLPGTRRVFIHAMWKKPFCFSFPPENSRIEDRKSHCRYQNNLPAAHTVFLNYPSQKSYGRKIPARNNRYGRKIPAFWCQERRGQKIPASNYRYGRKIRLPVNANTAGKSRQVTTWYGRKIRLPVTADTAGNSRQVTTRYGRKIRLPVTTETAGKSWQRSHKCYNWRRKLYRKLRPTCQKLFLLYVRI